MALQRPRIGSLTDLLEIDGLRDHVLSWLHVKDVSRLASTCKGVRLAVEEEDDAGGTKLRAVNLSLTFSLRPPFPGENESENDEDEAAAAPGAPDDEENKVHAVVVPSNLSPVLNRISIDKLQGLTIAVKASQDDLVNQVYTQRRNGGINVDFNTALGAVHSLLGKELTSLAIFFHRGLPAIVYAARVDAANFSHFANALAHLPRLEYLKITQTLGLLRTSFATERARNGRARIPFPALRRLFVAGVMPLEQIERDSLVCRACIDHQINARAAGSISISDRSTSSGSSDQQLLHDATGETNMRPSKEKGRTFGKLVQFSCRTTTTSALAVGGGTAPGSGAREFWSSAVSSKTKVLAIVLEGSHKHPEQERAVWDSPWLWHGATNVEHLATNTFPAPSAGAHFPKLWSLAIDETQFSAVEPARRESFAFVFDDLHFAQNIKRLELRHVKLSQLEIGILIGRMHDGNFLPSLLPEFRHALRDATEEKAQNMSSSRLLTLSAVPARNRRREYPYEPSIFRRAD